MRESIEKLFELNQQLKNSLNSTGKYRNKNVRNLNDILTDLDDVLDSLDDLSTRTNNKLDHEDFKTATSNAIRYLLKNHDPHTMIVIDYQKAFLCQQIKGFNLNNEIPD